MVTLPTCVYPVYLHRYGYSDLCLCRGLPSLELETTVQDGKTLEPAMFLVTEKASAVLGYIRRDLALVRHRVLCPVQERQTGESPVKDHKDD